MMLMKELHNALRKQYTTKRGERTDGHQEPKNAHEAMHSFLFLSCSVGSFGSLSFAFLLWLRTVQYTIIDTQYFIY